MSRPFAEHGGGQVRRQRARHRHVVGAQRGGNGEAVANAPVDDPREKFAESARGDDCSTSVASGCFRPFEGRSPKT